MASIDRVAADAAELGLAIEIRTLDASTRTAEEAAAACGCDVAQIVKSLVFEDSGAGEIVLLLVSGRHNVDLDFLRSHHGLDLRRCDPRRVRDETGFAIGGVAPIGHLTKPSIWMDRVLDGFGIVYAAAGRPNSVFAVDPRQLRQAIGATALNVNQKSAASH
ncbi:YbaK/EbsC family protein [Rhizobium sp. EC-SD404]|uniref:YbaK/EbsC family protein n=1 Tax=Rhizobium sp. EC-SD404 TaxID=2038389 RepID=UPI001256C648|nr:YbaK/EbsC family protein [Rhizobium sp. EC-SD404]VVT19382.1 YbaK/prolyl-tRNA synthetase associated region [Rhizobium sp. EC-SD404]